MIEAKNHKQLSVVAWCLSIIVPLLVAVLLGLGPIFTVDIPRVIFPAINACINSLVAIFLVLGVVAITKKNVKRHQTFLNISVLLSVLFLVSYVTARLMFPDARYGDVNMDGVLSDAESLAAGNLRYVYYFVLISHIALSVIIIPFVCFTYIRGLKAKELGAEEVASHRKLAKITFPMWLYVAVTGVLVFVFMRNYY